MENKNQGKDQEVIKRLFEITAKAVIVKDNKVLVLKRSDDDPYSPGKYDLPGGTIEEGEKIAENLQREIKEETALDVEVGPIVYWCDFNRDWYLDKEKKDFVNLFGKGLRFLAYYKQGEVKLSEEHESYEWLDFDTAASKFNKNDGFEGDKKEAIIKAKEYLELEDSLNGWRRCQADFENYKKRQAQSQKEMIEYSNLNLIVEILPVIDNFRASTEHVPEKEQNNPWVTGIMYIQKQLEDVLKNHGIEELEVKVGDEFNPAFHEAIEDKECKPGKECKNKVKKVVQRGYKLGTRVIRPARVIVE